MDKLVNIPRSNADVYYRYKMPLMQIKIEGKGNGIRTVVTNMEKIMKALDRPMEYGARFIGSELGTKYKCDTVQKSVMFAGKHSEETLASCLDKFIILFVLCQKCQNPETIINVKNNKIGAKCKACGSIFKIDENHKLSNFIIKSNVKIDKKVEVKEVKIVHDEKWSLDTSESAVAARKQQLIKKELDIENTVYPIQNLISYVNQIPTIDDFINELTALKILKSWSETVLIKYIFSGLFMQDITKDFYRKLTYIHHFVENSKEMMIILLCIEKYMEEHPNDNIVNILNGFYEKEILEEDEIFKWYDNKSKVISEELLLLKIRAKPFIEWLETAEYES